MKLVSRGAIAGFLGLLMAPPLFAQGARFSLGAGVSVPTGDFNTIAKLGWHAAAAVLLGKQTRPLGLQVDAGYAQFGLDASGAGGSFDVKERFIYGTGDVVFRLATSGATAFRPYLLGGVGIYSSKGTGRDAAVFGGAQAATDFGVNAGAGFNYVTGGTTLFVEARFHSIFTDPTHTQFVPLTAGFRFGG
jgi:hypothetical protein